MGDVFAKVEFVFCLRWWLADSSLRRVERGRLSQVVFFVYFMSIVCDRGMKEGLRARMTESCDITRRSLHSHC